MALASITSYAPPISDELPANIAKWTPDPERAALLIHDMQHYFLRPFDVGVQPHVSLVHNVATLRKVCAQLDIPVIYTAQPGGMTPQQRGLLMDFWGPGMSARPEDRDIPPEIAPGAGDIVVTKWRANAFHGTELDYTLRTAHRDQLIICGVYAHVGILQTACDAFARSVQPFVVADAIADFTAEQHRMAINYVASQCARVDTTSGLISALAPQPLIKDA